MEFAESADGRICRIDLFIQRSYNYNLFIAHSALSPVKHFRWRWDNNRTSVFQLWKKYIIFDWEIFPSKTIVI